MGLTAIFWMSFPTWAHRTLSEVKEHQDHEMNKLVDYFGSSVERLGAFYPTHCLVAIFQNSARAEATRQKLLSAGFAPADAIAADGKAVLEFDKDEKDLARFILQAISRFFATEQAFADHDLQDARHGSGLTVPTSKHFA